MKKKSNGDHFALKIKTSKNIKKALASKEISFVDRLKQINEIIFEYKLKTYGSKLEV